jgi:hypothetical protein
MKHRNRQSLPASRAAGLRPCRRPVLPRLETDTETRYLDRDGDGLLDAVETLATTTSVDPPNGTRHVVHVVRTVAIGIEEDGVPQVVVSSST